MREREYEAPAMTVLGGINELTAGKPGAPNDDFGSTLNEAQ